MKYFTFAFFTILVVCCSVVNAQEVPLSTVIYLQPAINKDKFNPFNRPSFCDDEQTIVYYGNGINTRYPGAFRSVAALYSELESEISVKGLDKSFGERRYASSFNLTLSNFFEDTLFKVIPDKFKMNTAQLWRYVANIDVMPDFLAKFIEDAATTVDRYALEGSVPASNFKLAYDDALKLGRKAMIVGHSHGTIVANINYANTDNSLKPGMGTVMVALMDNEIKAAKAIPSKRDPISPSPYVTNEEDHIAAVFKLINFGDVAGGFTLGANTNNWVGLRGDAKNGHGFVSDYMTPAPKNAVLKSSVSGRGRARDKVLNQVITFQDKLIPKPCHGIAVSTNNGAKTLSILKDGKTEAFSGFDVQSPQSNAFPSKFVDWKGRFVSGEATRVLSWSGPASRYSGPFEADSLIYRDGLKAYNAPSQVLGAAIQTDFLDEEWVIAVTLGFGGNKNVTDVWKRPADVRDLRTDLFDPQVAPNGWRKIGTKNHATDLVHSPWFFNGDGTAASSLRREEKSVSFSAKEWDGQCAYDDFYMNPLEEECKTGWGAKYPAGQYMVHVLIEHTLNVPLGASSTNFGTSTVETGDKAVLAIDYDDDEKLILREVNLDEDRGLLMDPDLPTSRSKWLTINDMVVAGDEFLDCKNVNGEVCRKMWGTGYSNDVGGFFTSIGEWGFQNQPIKIYHVFYADIRTETFAYSVREDKKVEYWLTHKSGASTLRRSLGQIQDIDQAGVGLDSITQLYTSSRYGKSAEYYNQTLHSSYIDYEKSESVDIEKINPVLGQYEIQPGQNQTEQRLLKVGPIPDEYGFEVSPNGTLLATGRLSNGQTFNFYSDPGTSLGTILQEGLAGRTLLPIRVQ